VSEWPPEEVGTERLQAPGEPLHTLTHEPIATSPVILRRRQAAARVRSRRQLVGDATLALAIVLVALIAGTGVGMLGVIAVLVLAGFGSVLAVGCLRRRRRNGHRAAKSPRRRRTR
jgi:Flp pilus assembly protein TadB